MLTNYRLANIPNTFIKVLCFKQVDDFAPCLKFKNDKTRQDKGNSVSSNYYLSSLNS